MTNPLRQLGDHGQSPWYDFITRDLIASGELARLIREDGLRGMTTNPTIFEKAIAGSDLYDADIRRLAAAGRTPAENFEALAVADEQVEALLEEGWRPKDIALITMGARHPVQAERQQTMGFAGYWDDFWSNDDIFYGHVLGFKGMERRAVVLCVNEDGTRDRGRERLYVGLSRATDRLVVVGDLAAIERMGGGAVAQHLGTA